jgi:hypothetical protein
VMLGFWLVEVKLLGPVQLYVAPVTVVAVRLSVDPAQIGLLLDAVGAEGTGLTTTVTVATELVHPLAIAVTEYVPLAAVVALVMLGFWLVDAKLLGPVQLYVAPVTVVAVRLSVDPAQIGLLLDAVGAEGTGLTTTVTVATELVHPLAIAVTVYVPLAAVVALVMLGFWLVEAKLLGPVQLYVAPVTVVAVRLSVDPAHIGLLLDAVGAEGVGLTVTVVVPAALGHPPTVIVTE